MVYCNEILQIYVDGTDSLPIWRLRTVSGFMSVQPAGNGGFIISRLL